MGEAHKKLMVMVILSCGRWIYVRNAGGVEGWAWGITRRK